MLKIIPTTSVNNEEFLKKEMNIHTSLADFISEAENADKLISTISLLFKDEKKNEKAIYDKLLFIFSLVLNGKNVEYAEKMKKSIENVISAAKSLKVVDENKILSDVYFMFPEGQFETKELLLEKIVAVEGKNYEQVVDIFYNAFKINKKSISKILALFAVYISKNKKFHLIKSHKEFFINNLLNATELSTEQKQLLFYLVTSSMEITKVDLKHIIEKVSGNETKNENSLLSLLSGEQKKVFTFNYDSLVDVYGEDSTEEIKMLSKQFALRDVLLGLGETISFDELANKVGVSFEEIEDVLIDGDNFGMFKVKINYEKKTIRKLFVKKSSYSKEEIETLNKTINSMKGKIAFVVKALESI